MAGQVVQIKEPSKRKGRFGVVSGRGQEKEKKEQNTRSSIGENRTPQAPDFKRCQKDDLVPGSKQPVILLIYIVRNPFKMR